jgi:hypothetical protein
MDFSPEKLRAHFADLTKKHDAITAKLQPLRDELDALGGSDLSVSDARKREEKLRPQIVKHQQELAPIEAERAAVARALGGKTSTPEGE